MYSYSFIWNKVKEVIRSTLDGNMGEGNDVVYMEFYNDTELVELTENEATVLVKYQVHYHVLNDKVAFRDLGADYYNQFNRERKANGMLKKLKALGYEVTIAAVPELA